MTALRSLILKVEDRVFATLTRFGAERNLGAERYATVLFEAAYAVRCGIVQGDEKLEDAIDRIHRSLAEGVRPAAALAVTAPAPSAGARAPSAEIGRLTAERNNWKSIADRVPELERNVSRLLKERDAAQAAGKRASVADLEHEREAKVAAVARAEGLERAIERLKSEKETQQGIVTRWVADAGAQRERAERAEAELASARAAGAAPRDGMVAAERRAVIAEAVADDRQAAYDRLFERAQSNLLELDRLKRSMQPRGDAQPTARNRTQTRAPAAAEASVETKKPAFIWGKGWGRG